MTMTMAMTAGISPSPLASISDFPHFHLKECGTASEAAFVFLDIRRTSSLKKLGQPFGQWGRFRDSRQQ